MDGLKNDLGFAAAVWHGPRDVRIERRVRAPLAPGEVRIAVTACGICGSDIHEYRDGPHAIPVGQPHGLSGVAAPLVIGHEFAGRVIETANDVSIAVGTRVAIEPEYRCGTCDGCRRGAYNQCDFFGFAGLMGHGGMAEEATIPAYMAHPLPDNVTDDQAAVLEPAAVALHAVRRAGMVPGDAVAVAGAGPIGLLIVQMSRLAGARRIVVSDMDDRRLALARQLGATATVNAASGSLAKVAGKVDIAFEAVGVQPSLDEAIAAVRKGGKVVLVGLFGVPARIDAFALLNREIDIITSAGYRHVYGHLIEMIANGIFDPSPIITRRVALTDVVAEGFERALTSSADVKILVTP